jgi:cyclophilin family peptidyl-prolyl cis-trans isomerase/HEAT repeat protein
MGRQICLVLGIIVCGACAASAPVAPPVPVVPPPPPVVPWETKLGWIMRLEDQRILRDPNPAPPVVLVPATRDRPAVVAPPPPSDLIRLMSDPEARTRRRAALAAGRVGLPEAVEPLSTLLTDSDGEVRQMAAFALGLIGQPASRPMLQAALKDADPIVQGRAAEALGMIGERSDAPLVSEMVQAHVKAGALGGVASDELGHPLAPAVETVRLGLFALVRLGSYEALAAAALDAGGQPVSRWWPVAYAFQRLGDAKAAPTLMTLSTTEGRFTAAFAVRGLGVVKARTAVDPLVRIVEARRAEPAIIVEAIRALAAIGDQRAAGALIALVADAKADRLLRLEALSALGSFRSSHAVELLLDLLSDQSPLFRAGAMRALAASDPETFLTALSGLDPDRDWTVRAAQAAALGTLSAEQARPRLMTMLKDGDQRVIPSVLGALVAVRAPGVESILLERLKAEDFMVRAAAANGLGELKAASASTALAEGYRDSRRDPTYVARAAVLAALSKVDPAGARMVLQEALADPDWAVRVRAVALLREVGATEQTDPAIRPAPSGRAVSDAELQRLVAPAFSPHAYLETQRGTIEIELAVLDAPLTVSNFVELARRGFFNGVGIHRVVPDFVVQDGDPRGDGEGGPGYTIRDEINQRPFLRGTVGMALDWKDTGGSQFFITHSPQPHLDGRYTVFGHVVIGMEVVDRIQPGDVIREVRIWDGVTP